MFLPTCKNGWVSFENSCYFFSEDTTNWEGTEFQKKSMNIFGYLVEFGSQMELEIVGNLAMTTGSDRGFNGHCHS
ncbi:hypothetical protein ScPMuIL_017313 [Solemya velum]